MNPKDRVLLEQLKVRVAERLPLERVVLFGSRARGDSEPDSDLDVLVVLEGPVSRAAEDYVRECAWQLGFESGVVIFALIVSREEWDDGLLSASSLALAVRRDGIAV